MAVIGFEVLVNGERHVVTAETLERALLELGFGATKVATALNGDFVPVARRDATAIKSGDRIEVVAARAGG